MLLLNICTRWNQRPADLAGLLVVAALAGLSHLALAQPVAAPAQTPTPTSTPAPVPVPVPVPERIASLRWIGSFALPTGTMFEGTEFGGISGLDRAPDGTHWAVSDDREAPRVYALRLDLDQHGLHGVRIEQVVKLLGPDGRPLPARTADTEALCVTASGQLLIASEGQWSTDAAQRHPPFVREFHTDGRWVRSFTLPEAFDYADNRTTGARNNKVFESLAITPDSAVFVATEEALADDGPVATAESGSWLRVIRFDPVSGAAVAQHAHALPPIPVRRSLGESAVPRPRGSHGLTDLLAVSEDSFIAVERAYVPGEGVTVRLVLTRIEPATTDVAPIRRLPGAAFQPMLRQLLL